MFFEKAECSMEGAKALFQLSDKHLSVIIGAVMTILSFLLLSPFMRWRLLQEIVAWRRLKLEE